MEAFDAPLSQRGLPLLPGPATGRSGTYPGGTHTHWPGRASRTHHRADLKVVSVLATQSHPHSSSRSASCSRLIRVVQAKIANRYPELARECATVPSCGLRLTLL